MNISRALDKTGSLGALVSAMSCAGCFPAPGSLGAAIGLAPSPCWLRCGWSGTMTGASTCSMPVVHVMSHLAAPPARRLLRVLLLRFGQVLAGPAR